MFKILLKNILQNSKTKIATTFIALFFFNSFIAHAQIDNDIFFVENQALLVAITKPGGALYLKTTVEGSLFLGNRNEGSDIVDLKSLASITSIKGELYIMSNLKLNSLDGLEGINEVESIYIKANPLLTSLAGFSTITVLSGDLEITLNTALTSLVGFENLISVNGAVEIFLNSNLTSLEGLNNLTTIGDLTIDDNDLLTSFEHLGIVTVGNFNVRNNNALTSFSGLQLNSVKDIVISSNSSLKSLDGLEKIKSVNKGVFIYKNDSLQSLKGMCNVIAIGGSLDIWGNTSLISLDGLNNITSVGKELHIADNPNLTRLAGLDQITTIQSLSIVNNVQLNDFCAINILITSLQAVNTKGNFRVAYNEYNPTLMDFQNEKCFSDQ